MKTVLHFLMTSKISLPLWVALMFISCQIKTINVYVSSILLIVIFALWGIDSAITNKKESREKAESLQRSNK